MRTGCGVVRLRFWPFVTLLIALSVLLADLRTVGAAGPFTVVDKVTYFIATVPGFSFIPRHKIACYARFDQQPGNPSSVSATVLCYELRQTSPTIEPPPPYNSASPYHSQGTLNTSNGQLTLPTVACNALFPGVSGEIVLQLDKSGTPLSGEVHVVYDQSTIDCTGQTPSVGAVTQITDLIETNDADLDGCPDYKELQATAGSQASGGLRDPFNPYDYFNTAGNAHQIRVDDILAVVHQFFKDSGNPAYTPETDRTALGPSPWNLGPPNGQQRVDDILAEVKQFFHDCGDIPNP